MRSSRWPAASCRQLLSCLACALGCEAAPCMGYLFLLAPSSPAGGRLTRAGARVWRLLAGLQTAARPWPPRAADTLSGSRVPAGFAAFLPPSPAFDRRPRRRPATAGCAFSTAPRTSDGRLQHRTSGRASPGPHRAQRQGQASIQCHKSLLHARRRRRYRTCAKME